jgi:hypothetical protein
VTCDPVQKVICVWALVMCDSTLYPDSTVPTTSPVTTPRRTVNPPLPTLARQPPTLAIPQPSHGNSADATPPHRSGVRSHPQGQTDSTTGISLTPRTADQRTGSRMAPQRLHLAKLPTSREWGTSSTRGSNAVRTPSCSSPLHDDEGQLACIFNCYLLI